MTELYADVQVAEFVPAHLCTKDTGVEQSSGLSVFQCHIFIKHLKAARTESGSSNIA